MKKLGFTLAELIITLSIIGIVSALMAPAVKDLMPDKKKVQVTQFHALLTNTIDEMFADESIFRRYTEYDSVTEDIKFSCSGLDCIEDFAQSLQGKLEGNYTVNDNNDGSYEIKLKVDESDEKSYSQDCDYREINTFIFDIDKYGTVSAGDALTDAYLRNPLNMNDRKKDLETAKKLLSNY